MNVPIMGLCRFNVLGLHEFDSDRKRMSVILGCSDNSVKLFVKGADTSMFSVINKSLNTAVIQATETHLQSYSSVGLRTLVIGMRDLNPSEFEQWHFAFEAASTSLIGRAALLRKVATNVENNLCILGATAIEDKLQQGVPESIESLRKAGIKVWVLTGDKQETAISIGYSSKLLTSSMTQIRIKSNNRASCQRDLQDALMTSRKNMAAREVGNYFEGSSDADAVLTPMALIIDGTSLVYILDSKLEEEVCADRSQIDGVHNAFHFMLISYVLTLPNAADSSSLNSHVDVLLFYVVVWLHCKRPGLSLLSRIGRPT